MPAHQILLTVTCPLLAEKWT